MTWTAIHLDTVSWECKNGGHPREHNAGKIGTNYIKAGKLKQELSTSIKYSHIMHSKAPG